MTKQSNTNRNPLDSYTIAYEFNSVHSQPGSGGQQHIIALNHTQLQNRFVSEPKINRRERVNTEFIRLGLPMFKTIIAFVFLFFSTNSAFAQGYTDFEFSIDRNFRFVRCTSLQTIITNNGRVCFDPTDYPAVGPINKYSNQAEHIFTKNLGRKLRNQFPNDTFEEIDETVSHFFIIDKTSEKITGPLTKTQFDNNPVVKTAGQIRWKHPYNPLGFVCLFSCFTIMVSPFALLVFKRYRRRKQLG